MKQNNINEDWTISQIISVYNHTLITKEEARLLTVTFFRKLLGVPKVKLPDEMPTLSKK